MSEPAKTSSNPIRAGRRATQVSNYASLQRCCDDYLSPPCIRRVIDGDGRLRGTIERDKANLDCENASESVFDSPKFHDPGLPAGVPYSPSCLIDDAGQ